MYNEIFIYIKANEFLLTIPTNRINAWLKKTTTNYVHPLIKGKNVKFKYAVQIKNNPMTIKMQLHYIVRRSAMAISEIAPSLVK